MADQYTPTYGLPSPFSIGPVSLGAKDVQELCVRLDALLAELQQDQYQTGDLMLMAGESIPTGWLLCNAAAVSRTGATKALFETIGTTWGVGNGSTTFNLPGSENRILIGVGIAGPGRTKHELGKTGGVETVTLTGNQSGVPEHSHLLTSYFGLWASANSISAHYWESGGKYAAGVQGESYAPYSGAISGVGASSAHNNMPYYAPLSWLVKT